MILSPTVCEVESLSVWNKVQAKHIITDLGVALVVLEMFTEERSYDIGHSILAQAPANLLDEAPVVVEALYSSQI